MPKQRVPKRRNAMAAALRFFLCAEGKAEERSGVLQP